eukprot:gene10546-3065_t
MNYFFFEKEKTSSSEEKTKIGENSELKIEKNVKYTVEENDKLCCNIFTPNLKDDKIFPTIIFVHGGSWKRGDRNHWYFDVYSRFAQFFVSHGFVVVVPSYRLEKFPTQANDLADCILWTTKNISKYSGDPNSIFLIGHSAGGHLVSLLTVEDSYLKERDVSPSIIKACVGISGVYDIQNLSEQYLPRKFVIEPTFGTNSEDYKKSSPVHIELKDHLKDIPFFLINAYYDLGLEKHATEFQKKLKEIGNEKVKKVMYEKTDHLSIIGLGASMGVALKEMQNDILDFLKKELEESKIETNEEKVDFGIE